MVAKINSSHPQWMIDALLYWAEAADVDLQ
jgi:hypothetical protein